MDNTTEHYDASYSDYDDDDDFIVVNTGPKSFAEYMELIKRREEEKNKILLMNNEVPYVRADMPNGIESGSLQIANIYWNIYGAQIYTILSKKGSITRLFLKNHFYSTMSEFMISMNRQRNFSQVLYAMSRGTRVLWVKDCIITMPPQYYLQKDKITNQKNSEFDYIMSSVTETMQQVSL